MKNKFKPISISLSPNVEKDDVLLALNLLIRPWKWKNGKEIKILENEFANYLGVKHAISFNSGRSSLFAILKSLELPEKSSVLLQAFTCNASINPALWLALNPIYVDCNQENFNMDIDDLKKKIARNKNAKVLIVQHTFGLPACMKEIVEIAENNNLILIEDCAHSLGASYNGKLTGTFGKAGFFSFSRDKVISCVYGGMAVTNDDKLGKALRQAQGKMGFPNPFWIMQQLLHPILLHYFILPVYNFLNLGKLFLIFSQITHILSKAVHFKEKQGEMPDYFPKSLPNAMSILALNQFAKLDKFYSHRKKMFEYYYENLKDKKFVLPKIEQGYKPSYLRFTVKHPDAHKIIYSAWHKENILLGDWYTTPIAPFDTNLEKMHYKEESCLNAEILSETTLNLPTHINIKIKDADRIINFLKQCLPATGREIKEIVEKNIWEDFLLQCKEKTFLDSWNWQDFNEKMARKSWRFGIYNGDKLISVFLVSKIGAKRSTFLFIPHGPVILENILLNEKKDILKIILQNLKKLALKEKASFIRISPIWNRTKENQEIFRELGFRLAPIHMHPEVTWELDISLSLDDILKNMRKTTRYLIRQAEKNKDIEIVKSERLEDLKYFNHIYKETGKRQKFVVYKEEYIRNEFLTFLEDKEICLFLGKYKGEVAVAAIFVFWQNGCFYHHSGSLPEYNKFPVSYLLQWEAIKEAKRRGCNVYNFWGIATDIKEYEDVKKSKHPWAGLSLFKMGFGGEKKEYVKTQDYIVSQKYWINYLIEVVRKFKRGL